MSASPLSERKRIYLSCACDGDQRTWCQDDDGPCKDCGKEWTAYVLASELDHERQKRAEAEKILRSYQGELAKALARAESAERDLAELKNKHPSCAICGRIEPCMSEADLKPDDPGTPCTFDPLCVKRAYDNGVLQGKRDRDALREALRRHAITTSKVYRLTDRTIKTMHCAECAALWVDNDEKHSSGCMVAAVEEKKS